MAESLAERIDKAPFLFDQPTVRDDIGQVLASDIPWDQLNGKTVLISGAAGMLPAAMVDALMSARTGSKNLDVRIVALVRSRKRAELRFGHWLGDDGFSLLEQDVTQPLPSHIFPQLIIHAASLASPKFYGLDPVGTMLPNVVGTLNLLKLARDVRAERFLFFSSAEVYGRVSGELSAIDEDAFGSLDPNDNRSCYAESKRMGEALCSAYALQYGVPATMVRPFHTYGPGMKLDDGRVFADFIRDAVAGQDIVVKGAGLDERSFCYLSDATAAYMRVLLCGQSGHAYNIGNPAGSISIRELAALIAGFFPQRHLKVNGPATEPRSAIPKKPVATRPDIAKIKALGWLPTTSVDDGFRRSIDYFMAVAVKNALK